MQLTVLGAGGAWPTAGRAASGFLVEHDGFRLLLDIGYAVVPRLLQYVSAGGVDAVFVTHGHPDHCADLNPLLRARALVDEPDPPLPVYAPPGALDAVLALDRPGMLDGAYDLHEFGPGASFEIGRSAPTPGCCRTRSPTPASGSQPARGPWPTPATPAPAPRSSHSPATPTCSWPRRRTPTTCRPTPRAR